MARGKIAAKVGRAACPHAAEGGVWAAKNAKSANAMKPSGVAWLGDIPEGWEVDLIGSFYSQRNEKVSDRDYPPLSVTMKGVLPQLATVAKTDDGDNRKLVKKGDFAINSRSDRRGSCGISEYDGSVSLINTILMPRGEMEPRYYNWLFHTDVFADEFYKWGHGIVDDLWTTRWSEMKRIQIVRPPLPEQRAIADYLDEKCGAIDAAIAEANKGIEEYKAWKKSLIFEAVTGKRRVGAFNAKTQSRREAEKMKSSGIPWIGEIPEGWKVSRVKNECDCLDYLREPISAENRVNEKALYDYYGASGAIDKIDDFNVDDTVLLIGEDGANLRMRNLPLVYRASGKIWVNNHAHILKVKLSNDYGFMAYALEAGDYNDFVTGSAQPKLTQTDLMAMPVVLPSLPEQQAIADYLDEKCAAIDAMVAEKEALIADLEAYKKSLIYETVTGKREVA